MSGRSGGPGAWVPDRAPHPPDAAGDGEGAANAATTFAASDWSAVSMTSTLSLQDVVFYATLRTSSARS